MVHTMQKHIFIRVLRLAGALFIIWLLLWKGTPILVAHCPNLAHYGAVALENDIIPGALYYTDVPVSPEAERNNRDTVRFLPHGGNTAKP